MSFLKRSYTNSMFKYSKSIDGNLCKLEMKLKVGSYKLYLGVQEVR
jgi:hypothetical protein